MIERVLAEYPELTIEGFDDPRRPGFAADRARLGAATDQVARACAWLRLVPRTKTPGRSSYYLKHVAEGWAGGYIANGALIAAALALGFAVKRFDRRRNPLIAVGAPSKWPREALPQSFTVWTGGDAPASL